MVAPIKVVRVALQNAASVADPLIITASEQPSTTNGARVAPTLVNDGAAATFLHPDVRGRYRSLIFRIGVVGSNMVDLVTTITRMPEAGETLEAPAFAMGPGGKGANQAVAAARLGASVVMVSAVGDDVFGGSTIETLRESGIDTTHVRRVAGTASGVAPIFVAPGGENRILIVKGANDHLAPDDIDRAMPALRDCAMLLLQLEIPLETVYHAIDRAREAGIPVLLNPAPATDALSLDRIRHVAFFAPNQTELAILTGRPAGTAAEAETAARVLLEAGIGTVIITLGADGALLVEAGGTVRIDPVPVSVVDTTGAGDAFIGAFATHHAALGLPVDAALRRASAYAAQSVTGRGTQSSFPDRAAFASFCREHRLGEP